MKMEKTTKKKISNKIFTAIAVILAVLSLAAWLPELFGLKAYYVETGSMAPAMPVGSMAYIKPVEAITDIKPGEDVLLFSNEAQTMAFMHRALGVDVKTNMVYTKGDANKTADLMPTSFSRCSGRVVFTVPLWGYVAKTLNSFWGKLIVLLVYIIWLPVEIELLKLKKKAVKT